MKKRSLFLVLILILSILAGCGTSEETPDTTSAAAFVTIPAAEDAPVRVDTLGMTRYDLECGLSFYGPGNLKE